MIRFFTLGRLDLDGLPDAEAGELLRQPKRIAVLAYLCIAAPGRFYPRESLLEVFWDGRDRSRARAALRNTLFHLRRLLGQDTLLSRGDGLSVDRHLLWCDALAFAEAAGSARLAEAAALYRGDLMPEFSLPGSPAFERWLETERTTLRRLAERTGRRHGKKEPADRMGAGGRAYRRVAVLPFDSHRGRPEEERFASGLMHGITSALSRLSSVRVIGRSTAGEYGGAAQPPLERIASELDVDAVLMGSVRSTDEGLLLLVRLIDARTGRPIWADIEERNPSGALTLQGDLVLALLDSLGIPANEAERERIGSRPTDSIAAFERYLEGRRALAGRGTGHLEEAAERFREAIRLDPDFALAFSGLAEAYLLLYPAAGVRPAEARVRASDAARRALRIDPGLGEAHAALGLAQAVLEGEYRKAESHLRRATEMAPGYSTAHHWYGAMLSFLLRRFDEGERELALALDLDPRSAIIHVDMAVSRMNRGDRDGALDAFRKAVELEPDLWRAHHDLGVALVAGGAPDEGVDHLERAWRAGAWGSDSPRVRRSQNGGWRASLNARLEEIGKRPPRAGPSTFESALLCALLGRREEALGRLAGATSPGEWALVMQYYFAFEPLAAEERFLSLLEKAGFSLSS